jgi:UDP-N-acetylmuramoyl-tripeptide--D-alanyl-D-alanine ligase
VLNHDDELVRAMAAQTRARVLAFGRGTGADVRADDVENHGLGGMRFTLRYGRRTHPVRLPLLGEHNVYTALAAAAVGFAEGLSLDEIVAGLEQPASEPLRLVTRSGPQGCTLIDDTYNASPASMLAALDVLASVPGRHVAVLGDMFELGDAEQEGHRAVGQAAASVAQWLVAVGKRAENIAAEARAGGLPDNAVLSVPDAAAAVAPLRAQLRAGDVVLIKGSRGMHLETIVSALAEAAPAQDG